AGVRETGTAADIEAEAAVDDQTAAACRLHVPEIPRAAPVGDADERPGGPARPVESVAAEANEHVVQLRPIAGVAVPDREEAEQHALVCDAIEVVQLRAHAQLAHGIPPV